MHKPPRLAVEKYSASAPLSVRDRFYALWRLLATDKRIRAHIAYSKIYIRENLTAGVPKAKVKLVFHGVPCRFLLGKAGQLPMPVGWGLRTDDTVVVCPMRPEKPSVDVFLRAVARVKDDPRVNHLHLRFVVTGKPKAGPSLCVVRQQKWCAWQERLTSTRILFSSATLPCDRCGTCFTAHRSACSLLEAMALGAPVIASDVHGINEAIVDGESGLLFEPGKPDDLAECLVKLLTDPALASRVRKQAATRVRDRFEAHAMARGHLDVYQQILGGRAK